MHHLRHVFNKEKEEKAKFKLESKEKLKDDKKEKIKDKDKEKEKVKEKDKDKKDKKLTKMPSTVTSGVPFEEIFTLGVALPIFGVPLQQSVERSRCHDDTGLPLVVRNSIDYLQAHGLKCPQIYRAEPDKIKLQQLRKLYTDRGPTFPYHWDVPVACAMLKSFISELPESILTQEFHGQLEQTTAMSEPQREASVRSILARLPAVNHSLLGWLVRHLEEVLANETVNHANMSTILSFMCPALNMTHNLLSYFITKADKLFPDIRLTKYVPPLLAIPSDFPETAPEISEELRKQESLLNQIHAEMHAGFITGARDQQLWEAQRIVTQLKRKLRAVQKSVELNTAPINQPSVEEKPEEENARRNSCNEQSEDLDKPQLTDAFLEIKESPADPTFPVEFEDNFDFKPPETNFEFKPEEDKFDFKTPESSFDFKTPDDKFNFEPAEDEFDFKHEQVEAEPDSVVEKPKFTEKELQVLRLQLENAEYQQLKSLLQAKINSEQFEIVKLRSHVTLKNKQEGNTQNNKENKDMNTPEEQELKQKLLKENAMLEQKRINLINQIFQERVACIQLKIELAMKEILTKS